MLWLLAASVAIAGAPRLQMHAHEAADIGHEHVDTSMPADLAGPETSDQESPRGFHVHDATAFSFGIETPLLADTPRVAPSRWAFSPPGSSVPLTPRTPPHRPPIV